MAVNLRLSATTEQALRERAAESGRSQQEVLRAAVDAYLGQAPPGEPANDLDVLVAQGRLRPARSPYRRPSARRRPVDGMSTLDALDRDDRL